MQPLIRIQNPATIAETEIEQQIQDGKRVIVQFGAFDYNEKILADLNKLCAKYDDNLCIRFYGSNFDSFDCSIVNHLPDVKALSIDCMSKAHNIEAVTKLTRLQDLGIGIYEMKETEL
jgi:protein phosphatase 1 regulatory subunit 7